MYVCLYVSVLVGGNILRILTSRMLNPLTLRSSGQGTIKRTSFTEGTLKECLLRESLLQEF